MNEFAVKTLWRGGETLFACVNGVVKVTAMTASFLTTTKFLGVTEPETSQTLNW